MEFISIGKVASLLGVCICTLRRRDESGFLQPEYVTEGGHRRYNLTNLLTRFGLNQASVLRKTICYARVSGQDQKEQLQTQATRLEGHAKAAELANIEIITDLGSGLNLKKKGLNRLINYILTGQVKTLILTTQDRLLRFGAELVFILCKFFNIEVIILDKVEDKSKIETLSEDLVEIITVFSSRVYGARSRKNQKALKETQAEAESCAVPA